MFPDEVFLGSKAGMATGPAASLSEPGAAVSLSFEKVFDQYHAMVFRLAYRILSDREEALDVTQEVFLTIYRKMCSFRGDSSIKTWVYRITVNHASNRCRWWGRLRRRGTISLDQNLGSNLEYNKIPASVFRSGAQSPEENLLVQEERERIQCSLRRLPVHQRAAVIMRDIEGLSYEEIAGVKNMPLGTVKNKLFRARAVLKERLSGEVT